VKLQSINRYEAYKDSGVEWLGYVPAHWDILRVKDTVIKIGNGVTPKGGSEVYTDTGIPFLRSQNVYDDGLRIANVSFISKEIYDCMKGSQLKAGDILINITGASIGRTCVVPLELGAANINQHIAFLRTKFWFNIGYISLFLKSPFTKNYIQFEQNGASKEAFNLNQIANIPLVLPKHVEQQAIAAYLDTKTAQIDRQIDLLSQKTAQYGKLKQSLINETVTRGLDKTVPMKDSGVEWIGEVPEHWEVKRIKEVCDINKSTLSEKTPASYEFDYVDIGSVTYGVKGYIKERMTFDAAPSRAKRIVQKGDTIISTVRTYLKAITSIDYEVSDLIVSTGFAVISPQKKIVDKYCSYLLTSNCIVDEICALSTGVSYPATNATVIGGLFFLIPPIVEQQSIANYLDEKTAHIDRIVATINSQIDKLKELRLTLINDVVTGKIKVA